MMKGLFDHLLQSAMQQADTKIAELLPAAIAKEVNGQVKVAVQAAVQDEVAKQLAAGFSPEKMKTVLRELVREELGRHSTEQTGRHGVGRATRFRVAPPLIEQSTEKLVRELTPKL
ncbi:MAG: hypothetical protein U0361_06005 [Nitrospiraceae bacterium]